jgi:FkbM family methyltransferase
MATNHKLSIATEEFNKIIPWPFRLLILVLLALCFAYQVYPRLVYNGWAVSMKLRGNAPDCQWTEIFQFYGRLKRFSELQGKTEAAISLMAFDEKLGIELLDSPLGKFWIKQRGQRTGRSLLAYLLAEQEWLTDAKPNCSVRAGDIVIDCGAHVGVFTRKALQLGARLVVALEPEPVNLECLRRNFAENVCQGNVVIVPKGVWNAEGSVRLFTSEDNSGENSMVIKQEGKTIEVKVTTIDNLLRELKLPRVDYIKMDIEGAEREALSGALQTLKDYRPRLMLDAYHLPDDMKVLPTIVRSADPGYIILCGPCQPKNEGSSEIIPHTIYLR